MRKALTILSAFFIGIFSLQANEFSQAKKGIPMDIVLPEQLENENRDQTYQLFMQDSYGDGWNGASLDLYVNNVLVLDDVTVESATNEISLDVDDHDYIHTEWTSGSYDNECAYGLYDPNGVLVAEAGTIYQPDLTMTHTIDFSGVNVFANSGFEGMNADGSAPAEWLTYPGYNFSVETTGNGIYNSSETFTAYDGDKSFKMWSAGWEGSENNVFHEMSGDDVPLAGTSFNLSAMFYSHADDFIGQGSGQGKLTAKYFGFGPNGDGSNWWETMLFMDESTPFDASTATASTWENQTLATTVPEGVYLMQLGFMLYQPGADGGGSVYVDNFTATMDEPVEGCTDMTACNYNMDASLDDGSCCLTNCGDLTVGGGSYISEVSWEILDASGTVVLSDASGTPYDGETCLDDGVYTVNGFDSWGDGWNGNYLTLVDSDGYTVVNFTLESGSAGSTTFTLPFNPPSNGLVLAAVLDLTVPEAGSAGKAVVVQAFQDIDDLSLYGIGVANNGGGTDGQEYTFPAAPLDSGQVLWVIRDEAAYLNYFGNDMVLYTVDEGGSISQNGDDAIELFL